MIYNEVNLVNHNSGWRGLTWNISNSVKLEELIISGFTIIIQQNIEIITHYLSLNVAFLKPDKELMSEFVIRFSYLQHYFLISIQVTIRRNQRRRIPYETWLFTALAAGDAQSGNPSKTPNATTTTHLIHFPSPPKTCDITSRSVDNKSTIRLIHPF